MTTRLGLNIGTNSIGWCLYDGDSIRGIGVRSFSDGRDAKTGEPLAVDRRAARAKRRRRDRYLGRRSALLRALVDTGLMPADKVEARQVAALDPYLLRAKGVSEPLMPHELGRVLFHLNQRRGFKSNRKADRDPNISGKIADGAKALDAALSGRTYGQFLAASERKRVRMRPEGDGYDFYPERAHLEDEFDKIWATQATAHPALLIDAVRERLRRIVFFQRDLRQPKVGGCAFFHQEQRLQKSAPQFQELRLYRAVNELRVERAGEAARALTLDERNALIRLLKSRPRASFSMLSRTIKLKRNECFSMNRQNRDGLAGDEVFAAFSSVKAFGSRWEHFDEGTRHAIIEMVENEPDPKVLCKWLMTTHGTTQEQANAIGTIRLPEGHGRLGETASQAILAVLKAEVIDYDQAAAKALAKHHSNFRTGETLDRLPYYGELLSRELPPGTLNPNDPDEVRWGKTTNPTLHIGLNQLRKLVNALIAKYGRPDTIVIELARELKLNDKQKAKRRKALIADSRTAQSLGSMLRELGQPDNNQNRTLLRNWEALNPANPYDRRCPFCGGVLALQMLFNGEAEIRHLIPFSRSLDDSDANKVIAHRACNRDKGNKTPWEAWGETPKWAIIADQAAHLDKSKQWRFGPDAAYRLEQAERYIDRQLTDTHYLARMTRSYLEALYPDGERVFVIPGRMTALLRRIWGLNDLLPDQNCVENRHREISGNPLDYRHHAIDAAVVGMTNRGLMQRMTRSARIAEDRNLDQQFVDFETPWPTFCDDLHNALQAITISHKPDHGHTGPPRKDRDTTSGRLHNDTAYGFTGTENDHGIPIVVRRKMLLGLKPEDIGAVVDRALHTALHRATAGLRGADFESALRRFSTEGVQAKDPHGKPLFKGIRRVRIREPLNIIPIRDASGRAYKGYKSGTNARFDIWAMPDGKWVTKWTDRSGKEQSSVVSMFELHDRTEVVRKPHPAAKRVLSLRQNDMLAIERNGDAREIVRIVKFSRRGQVFLAHHNEAGPLKSRHVDPADPFKYIIKSASSLEQDKARQIRIDPIGKIFDPGWP